ncbi:solute carrier family 41 [Enteropsectra breve]|nr:solute carrier family 41 [Enteropsectra breve]
MKKMLSWIQRYINTTIIVESGPTLIISLIGLVLTGKLFEKSVKEIRFRKFPVMLEANCVLGFKGNIELSFAMQFAAFIAQYKSTEGFLAFALANINALFAQSLFSGLFIGIFAASYLAVQKQGSYDEYFAAVAVTVSSCFFSTLIFFIFLLLFIQCSKFVHFDLENILLPLLGSLNDFLIVKILLVMSLFFVSFSLGSLALTILGMLALLGTSMYFLCRSDGLFPRQNYYLLFFTSLMSLCNGILLEKYSAKFDFIAGSFPIIGGMCASIVFLYIHQNFENGENESSASPKSILTLLLIALIIPILYLFIAAGIYGKLQLEFCVYFMLAFTGNTFILLAATDFYIKKTITTNKHISPGLLPIVAFVSDLFAVASLILISKKLS